MHVNTLDSRKYLAYFIFISSMIKFLVVNVYAHCEELMNLRIFMEINFVLILTLYKSTLLNCE